MRSEKTVQYAQATNYTRKSHEIPANKLQITQRKLLAVNL